MAERELLVRILGDDRDLQRALGNTERRVAAIDNRTATFGKNITRAFGAAGIALGTATLFRGMDVAVEAASSLNEQIARSEQVFEKNAASVQEWSKTLASSFGISQAAGLEFAGTFGLLFTNIGTSTQDAEVFSRQLVELASDLASFNDTDVDTALNALRSGLTGEIEPLRRFGVFLSEARSNTLALTESGKKSTEQLTTQEKVLARLQIIMQDTQKAQGDFARTSDGLANKQRTAAAEAENLAANIGRVLAPAMDIALTSTIALTGGINDLIVSMEGLRTALRNSDFADNFNAAIEGANKSVVDFLEDIRDGIPGMQTFLGLRDRIVGGGGQAPSPLGDTGPQRGAGGRRAAREALEAQRELEQENERRGNAAIERITRQANAQKSVNQQLAESERRAAHLADLIREAPDNAKLQQRLSAELAKQNNLRQDQVRLSEQNAAAARDEAAARRDAALAVVELSANQARLTKGLQDDLAAAVERENTLSRMVSLNKEDLDLQRQLVQATLDRRDIEAEIRENRRKEVRGRQFKALGLTEDGQERTAGIDAIRRRARNLIDELKSSDLPPDKIAAFVKRISVIFTKQFNNAGKDVRAAILRMFGVINDALGQGDKQMGRQITPGGIRPLQRLIAGANLTEEQIAQLQRNMQRRRRGRPVNAFGVDFDSVAPSAGALGAFGGPSADLVPDVFVTVNIDGQDVTGKVVRSIQKTGKRRTTRRGGASAGRGAVL